MAKKAKQVLGHMHDFEAHVRAVEEDLEYYRTKRFEPRIIYLVRRGVVTFTDLLKAHASRKRSSQFFKVSRKPNSNIEVRVRALEEELDDYVKGIALVSSRSVEGMDMVIEDNRKERGDYDEFFRIAKKEHKGSLEERIENLGQDLSDYRMLLEAFIEALIQRGWVSREELVQRWQLLHEQKEWNGGIIVARAWTDPTFKANLMATGRDAVRELGIHQGKVGKLVVRENTESVHNVVVCTLCSCYPYDLLGDTPWWYKHDIYKKRIVKNPRATLELMFRLKVPSEMEIQVHDSTSDIRYMVLPRRPKGSEGLSEAELAKLVTVDSLIGAGEPLDPSRLKEAGTTEVFPQVPRARAD